MDINEQVKAILAYGETCDHCLGRFFGKRSHGLSDDERGRGLKIALATCREPALYTIQWHLLGLRQLL